MESQRQAYRCVNSTLFQRASYYYSMNQILKDIFPICMPLHNMVRKILSKFRTLFILFYQTTKHFSISTDRAINSFWLLLLKPLVFIQIERKDGMPSSAWNGNGVFGEISPHFSLIVSVFKQTIWKSIFHFAWNKSFCGANRQTHMSTFWYWFAKRFATKYPPFDINMICKCVYI